MPLDDDSALGCKRVHLHHESALVCVRVLLDRNSTCNDSGALSHILGTLMHDLSETDPRAASF